MFPASDEGFLDPGLLVCASMEGPIKVFTFVVAPTVTGTLFAWGPGEGEGGVSQPILKYQVATMSPMGDDLIPTSNDLMPQVKSKCRHTRNRIITHLQCVASATHRHVTYASLTLQVIRTLMDWTEFSSISWARVASSTPFYTHPWIT